MSAESLVKVLLDLLRPVGKGAIFALQRYWFTVILAAVALSLLMSGWSWMREKRTVQYILLDGPAGGIGRDQAVLLEREIVARSLPYGFQYAVETVHTNGYEENRQRINDDITRRTFGFEHDGFGKPDNVRVLLPLEKSYLHMLCRKKFLEQQGLLVPPAPPASTMPAESPRAVLFAQVCPLLQPGRAFLGPKGSGTQQAARCLFEFYGLDPLKFQAHGIADWHEMRSAMNTGAIDLAFYSGPLGSSPVARMARDDSCVLLDLGGDAEAILQTQPQFKVERIRKNSYASGWAFCCQDLTALAFRRVLIASRSMSSSDAHFLASVAKTALLPQATEEELKSKPAELVQRLRDPPHEGAVVALEGRTLSYLPQGVSYFLMTLGLCFVVELLRLLAARTNSPRAAGIAAASAGAASASEAEPAPPASTPASYPQLHVELEDLVLDLDLAPHPIAPDTRDAFIQRFKAQRQRLIEAAVAGKLDEPQKETLMNGVRQALRELLRGTQPPSAAAKALIATAPP